MSLAFSAWRDGSTVLEATSKAWQRLFAVPVLPRRVEFSGHYRRSRSASNESAQLSGCAGRRHFPNDMFSARRGGSTVLEATSKARQRPFALLTGSFLRVPSPFSRSCGSLDASKRLHLQGTFAAIHPDLLRRHALEAPFIISFPATLSFRRKKCTMLQLLEAVRRV